MCCFHHGSSRQSKGSTAPPLLGQFNQITAQLQGVQRTSACRGSVCRIPGAAAAHTISLCLHSRHRERRRSLSTISLISLQNQSVRSSIIKLLLMLLLELPLVGDRIYLELKDPHLISLLGTNKLHVFKIKIN